MTLRDRQVLSNGGEAPPPSRFSLRDVPPFCGALIAVCVAVFLTDGFFARAAPGTRGYALPWGALFGPAVASGQWWRLWTCAFEHAGVLHLALNMSVVFTLGFTLERAVGTGRMAAISFVTTLGSSTLAILFGYQVPTVGASGMILGWAGAMLPVASPQMRRSLVTWLAQVVVISLIPGVSWQGHLGGFLFGIPCGFALRLGKGRFAVLGPVLMAAATAAAVVAVRVAAARSTGGIE